MKKIIIIYILIFIILLLFTIIYSPSNLTEYLTDTSPSSITLSNNNPSNSNSPSSVTLSNTNPSNSPSPSSVTFSNTIPSNSPLLLSISPSNTISPSITLSNSSLSNSSLSNNLLPYNTLSNSSLSNSSLSNSSLSNSSLSNSLLPYNTISSSIPSSASIHLSSNNMSSSIPSSYNIISSNSPLKLSNISSSSNSILSNDIKNVYDTLYNTYLISPSNSTNIINIYNNYDYNPDEFDDNIKANTNDNNLTNNDGLIFFYKILQNNIKNNLLANIATTKIYDAAIINNISNIIDYNVNTDNNIIDYTFRNKNDGSIYFSGNLNYIQIPSFSFNNTGITIACYFYIKYSQKAINTAVLFDFGNGFNNNNITITINENNIFNKIVVYKDRMPYTAYFYLNDIQNYKWNHLAFVITDYPIWFLYFNGKPIQLSMNSSFIYPSNVERNNNFIGKNNKEEYSSGTYIDEFRIYNKSLSQDEIISIM